MRRRYEIALQPAVAPSTLPRCTIRWPRPNKEATDLLMTIADHRRPLCGVLESRNDVIVEYVVGGVSFALANAGQTAAIASCIPGGL